MDKPKRTIHHKERFLEGNRQKWLVIFLFAGCVVLFFDAINKIHNVDSYLTFLTFLSGSFILGYSGTETMKLFRVTSNREVIEERYTEDVKIEENINETSYSESVHTIILKEPLTHNAKEEDYKL
jgi:hypothetical protein